jgi:exodeoxyribonuclease VII large subunit
LIQHLAIVTSPTGAAIRDVLHVIERRQPTLQVVLATCRVQGQGAAAEIACAIGLVNEWAMQGNRIDAILITRGGGSLEDLWAFNEEVVARAVSHSTVPVVSAVGHEIDFTICDFVADLRAATPSAGAELLTEGMFRRREWVAQSVVHLLKLVRDRFESLKETFDSMSSRLGRSHPKRLLNERWQNLDELQTSLTRCSRKELRRHQVVLLNLAHRLTRVTPSKSFRIRRQVLVELVRRLQENGRHALTRHQQRIRVVETQLRLLSPQQVLERGFSITEDAQTGALVRDVAQVLPGQRLRTKLQSGEIISVAQGKQS